MRTGIQDLIFDVALGNGAANGVGRVSMTQDFNPVTVKVNAPTGSSFTLNFVKSDQDKLPDFTSPSVPGNEWEYVQVTDLDTEVPINGSTGIAVAAAFDESYEVNMNGARWFSALISNYVSGRANVSARLFETRGH